MLITSSKEAQNSTLYRETRGDHFWDSKELLRIEYVSPKTTMNEQYYASLLLKLCDTIKEKRRGMLTRGVCRLNDNALVHKSMIAQEAVRDCGFVQLDHHAYSPDMTSSDYFCSTIWSLTLVVSAVLTMRCRRKLSRSGWRDGQMTSVLVELTVCRKNVANALNSVVNILLVSRLNNRLMKACYSLYSRWTEFLDLMCTFNIDVNICSLVCLQSTVLVTFIVLWIVSFLIVVFNFLF